MTTPTTGMPSIDAMLQQSLEQVFELALHQHQAGLLTQAASLYLSVLETDPDHAAANHNMGMLAVQKQQPAAGLEYFQRALVGDAKREPYWLSYIDALIQAGELHQAQEILKKGRQTGLHGPAIDSLAQRLGAPPATASPTAYVPATVFSKAGHNRPLKAPSEKEMRKAVVLFDQGKQAELVLLAKSFIRRFPLHGFGWMMQGLVHQTTGQFEDALRSLKKAVEFLPDRAEAHYNLGTVFLNMMKSTEAADSFRKAIALEPDHDKATGNLGVALYNLGQLEEAERVVRRAMALRPDSPKTFLTLAMILKNQGRIPEEIQAYRRALSLQPDFAQAHCNLLFCMCHDVQTDAQQLFAEHMAFGAQFEAPLRAGWPAHTNRKDPDRCLRVGFVSADLYDHAVATFLEPVLAHLAKNPAYALHAYYNNNIQDHVTQRLRSQFVSWSAIMDLSDAALATQISADGIDILFDLSGHTGENRLLTFARKPAPIQISWLGYPGTTGLTAMDYYLTDQFFTPDGFDEQFTEKLVKLPLPNIFQPSEFAPPVNPLPALGNGFITFASFNRASKINDATLALWSVLLQAVPTSRMVLAGLPAESYVDLAQRFECNGIAQERLTFFPRAGIGDYMALHYRVDICLDTYPYGGGTTTFHAGWMGVPTLTMAGETPACRSGVSVMARWGLLEFAADSIEDFVAKGVYWSQHLDDLAAIRASMRQRFNDLGLGNAESLVTNLNAAMRTMWQRWCAGLPAQAFAVSPLDHA